MKIIAMIDQSRGNEMVGEMWTETKSFDETSSLLDVYRWAVRRIGESNKIRSNVKLSIDQSSLKGE
jgi:hypothetical protein